MIAYKDIRSVHFEISTRCNAACPDCPRNFRGVDILDTYPVLDMKLSQVQQIFPPEFVQQLDQFLINGNYGDFVTAQDGLAIVEYLLECNPNLYLEISTNGSAKPKIWQRLGELGITVDFRLDGLRDTHKLYRQNTDWDFIIDNAKKFIAAGGKATWAMIEFDHNRHQINECRQLSRELGFSKFWLIDDGRNSFPVFTSDKRLSHVVGNWQGSVDFGEMFAQSQYYKIEPDRAVKTETRNNKIDCYSTNKKEIYVSANGDVFPCCWLGYYPKTNLARAGNTQLQPIMVGNNAFEHGIEGSLAWFNKIEESWDKTVPDGKIYVCNNTCGIKE